MIFLDDTVHLIDYSAIGQRGRGCFALRANYKRKRTKQQVIEDDLKAEEEKQRIENLANENQALQ